MTKSEFKEVFEAFGYEGFKTVDTPLKCPHCNSPLMFQSRRLRCVNYHWVDYFEFTIEYISMIEQYQRDIINGTLDLGNCDEDNYISIDDFESFNSLFT